MKRTLIGIVLVLLAASGAAAQDQVISGTLSSTTCPGTGCVSLDDVNRAGGGGIQLASLSGTVTVEFESTVDCTTWAALPAFPAAGGASVTSATANGSWVFGAAGYCGIRARASANTGSIVATIRVTSGSQVARVDSAGGGLTDAELRATPVDVTVIGSASVTGGDWLTETQLRDVATNVTTPAGSISVVGTGAQGNTTFDPLIGIFGVHTPAGQPTFSKSQQQSYFEMSSRGALFVKQGVEGFATSIYDGADTANVTGTSLDVNCTAGCVSSFLDNATFTFGTTAIGNMGAVVDDVATNTVTENNAGAPRMSTGRVLFGNLRDSTGANEVSIDTNASPPIFGDYGLFTRSLTYARNNSNVYVEDTLASSAASVGSEWRVLRNVPPTDYEVDTLTVPTDRARFFVNDATNGIGVETCLARVRATTGTGTLRLYGRINADIDIDAFNLDTLTWVDGNSLPTNADYSYLIPCAGFQEVAIEAPTLTAGTFTITWSAGPGGNIPWRANTDSAAFTFGVANATAVGGVVDDTGTNLVAENSAGAARMSTRRELYSQIRDAAGNERGVNVTAANALKVDGSAVTQPVSGTVGVTGTVTVTDPSFTDAVGTSPPANVAVVGGWDGSVTRMMRIDTSSRPEVSLFTSAGNALLSDTTSPNFTTRGLVVRPVEVGKATVGIVINFAGDSFIVNLDSDNAAASVIISGTWVGTIEFRVCANGGASCAAGGTKVYAFNQATGQWVTETTVNGTFVISSTSQAKVEVFATAWTSGSADVAINESMQSYPGMPATNQELRATPLGVKELRAATPAVTSVAGSATSVTCLALNANRLGATIYSDSTADLYVKLGATASTSSFTVKVFPDGFFTVPFGYTGVIDCIWSSATGNARITEVTQ